MFVKRAPSLCGSRKEEIKHPTVSRRSEGANFVEVARVATRQRWQDGLRALRNRSNTALGSFCNTTHAIHLPWSQTDQLCPSSKQLQYEHKIRETSKEEGRQRFGEEYTQKMPKRPNTNCKKQSLQNQSYRTFNYQPTTQIAQSVVEYIQLLTQTTISVKQR